MFCRLKDYRRIATSYDGLVGAYLRDAGVSVTLVRLDGAVESAVRLGDADAVADVVETGSTLRKQGLDIFGPVILQSQAVLIGAPTDARDGDGHPGLGTSGSGDVLAGAITGLLARGASADQAACWGTFLHAVAGDRLAARVGRLGFLARELVDQLPIVLTETEA